MAWILTFHIVFFVAWFAGLFYLPRLFVYHADSTDQVSLNRFKIMEHKLYFYIMTPAAILTTAFGITLLCFKLGYFLHQSWMIGKLGLVGLLWIYHIYCGVLLKKFKTDRNTHKSKYYRFFNEVPTLLLILIVIMAIVRP